MMRTIETHKVNGLNEAIQIDVRDEPGAGGACHDYLLCVYDGPNFVKKCHIQFQNGPIKEAGINGISNEALLAVVRDRLECFQAGPYACDENQEALDAVVDAMSVLASRTSRRLTQGIEGTHEPDPVEEETLLDDSDVVAEVTP